MVSLRGPVVVGATSWPGHHHFEGKKKARLRPRRPLSIPRLRSSFSLSHLNSLSCTSNSVALRRALDCFPPCVLPREACVVYHAATQQHDRSKLD